MKKNADKKQSDDRLKSVTLKRSVTIRAIVTEDFRKYLVFELNQAIKNAEEKMSQIENQAKQALNTLKEQPGSDAQQLAVQNQLKLEQTQFQQVVRDFSNRIENAKQLSLDSLFTQGTVDGFVTLKEGDNLYQKLGGLEITVKDGIIYKICELGEGSALLNR